MRFVINVQFGGFRLSSDCIDYIKEKYGTEFYVKHSYGPQEYRDTVTQLEYRSDPKLLDAIDTLGVEKCAGKHTKLKVVTVPDEYSIDDLEIDEYDGAEGLQTIPVRFR